MKDKRILTIDDDEDINQLVKIILNKNGYEVETSSEIEDFFRKVVEFKPHLCIVDLNLGDHEGFGYNIIELMRKKIGKEVIIIIMSRRNSAEDITRALECGANDYIQKPIDEQIIISKLDVFLGNEESTLNLPFYAVATGDRECYFQFPLNIYSMTEETITIYSNNYIAKGSLIELNNSFLDSRSFTVSNVILDREKGGYFIEVSIDAIDHEDLLPTVRKIMMKSSPIAE